MLFGNGIDTRCCKSASNKKAVVNFCHSLNISTPLEFFNPIALLLLASILYSSCTCVFFFSSYHHNIKVRLIMISVIYNKVIVIIEIR